MPRKNKSISRIDAILSSDESVSQLQSILKNFEPLENRLLRGVLKVLPWLMLIFALYDFDVWIKDTSTVMWHTGYIGGALALLVAQEMIRRIPATFQALWDRQIVRVPSKSSLLIAFHDSRELSNSSAPMKEYSEFLETSQKIFNSSHQINMGIFITLFAFLGFLYSYRPSLQDLGEWLVPVIIFWLIPAFFTGILVWRMIIVGIQIWRLSQQFDISPQLGHPDQCGGLEPVGNICFWNALISSIAGVFFGGWIVLGPSLSSLKDDPVICRSPDQLDLVSQYICQSAAYAPLFIWALLLTVIISILSFLWPIWRIHQIMLEKRMGIRRQLDQLSKRIDGLTRELLMNADTWDPAESEKITKKIERMRQVYNENKSIAVWPFNTRIILKFTASQLVPILSLTGLGEGIVRLIASLFTSAISN